MALKRQQDMLATFSMASMTDVIFLLLVFFLVTSTFVFPTALDVNLPESSEQTPVKPSTRVYIDAHEQLFVSYADAEPQQVSETGLAEMLRSIKTTDPDMGVALYADTVVSYGKVVSVLNIAAREKMSMVLATKASASTPQTSTGE